MSILRTQRSGACADVALLLEGTYPYVRGGVSSWVQEIISGLPGLTFSVAFIGGNEDACEEPAYEFPSNVVHFERHFLQPTGRAFPSAVARRASSPDALREAVRLHDALRTGAPLEEDALQRVCERLGAPGGVTRDDFLRSEDAWRRICDAYRSRSQEPSFLDFFWSVRTMHAPLFLLAEVARALPPAKVFHAVSTGYAGFLGTLVSRQRRRPFVLTEHGIYTKERKIDLAHATWIKDGEGGGYLRRMWVRFFEALGRAAYASASPVVSLYEGNRSRQISDGAPQDRTVVVPNGVDIARFAPLRARRPSRPPPVIGLLGRVVPIKDVRTFVRAMRVVVGRLPEAEGWIIGPTAEDERYAQDCRSLIASLGLEGKVRLLGFRRTEEVLPRLGLLALTSISEALPLVVLEAFASGLPAVTTDVGACRELLLGRTDEDRAIGAAGEVVPVADADAVAGAALRLLGDAHRWHEAQRAGIERVERYYTRSQMLSSYRTLYEEAQAWRA